LIALSSKNTFQEIRRHIVSKIKAEFVLRKPTDESYSIFYVRSGIFRAWIRVLVLNAVSFLL
jgi:hypothetical protein